MAYVIYLYKNVYPIQAFNFCCGLNHGEKPGRPGAFICEIRTRKDGNMNTAGSGIKFIICIMAAAILAMAGCASSGANVYTREQTMQAHTVETGTVASVKAVTIQASTPPVAGGAIGGVTGGVLGSTIGSGHGRSVAAIVGALAGAALGATIEKEAGTRNGFEIVVNLDRGQTIVVVQEADAQIYPGDRVRVLTAPDGTTRVSK